MFEKVKDLIQQKFIGTPTRRRLANGAIWGGLAVVGSRIISVVASFFLARTLGQVGFGEYGMVNSTAGMIGSLAGLGIGLTVTKHAAQYKNSDPDKVGRILALSSIVTMISAFIYGLLFVIFASWLATKTIAAPHLAPLLQISAVTVAMGVINGVQTSSLDGCEAFRTKSYINIGTGIAQTIMVVAGAWFWGLKGSVVALALGMVLTVIVMRGAVASEWQKLNIRLQWHEAKKEWRVLINFSLPSFFQGIMVGPVLWVCSAFLVNQQNGYKELGVYNAANQWFAAIFFIPGLINTAVLPILSEKHGAGDKKGSVKIMMGMMGITALVVFPLAVILIILSPFIMSGYGPEFRDTHWTLIISLVTAVLIAIMNPVGQFIAASGKMWVGFFMNLGWSVVLISGSWLMVKWGANGLAGARLCAYMAHAIWVLGYVFMSINKRTVNE